MLYRVKVLKVYTSYHKQEVVNLEFTSESEEAEEALNQIIDLLTKSLKKLKKS